MTDGVIDGAEEIAERVVRGLYEQDVGRGRDRMRPFHVQGNLLGPTAVGRGAALCKRFGERERAACRGGETELRTEGVQVCLDVRVVIGVDNRDRHAATLCSQLG